MKYVTGKISGIGARAVNEDSLGTWKLQNKSLAVAIADGLGGMGDGEIASGIAIKMFGEAVQNDNADVNLLDVAERAHAEILYAQKQVKRECSMATTLTAAIFDGCALKGVHCGDSRVAVARADGIIRLTKDHTEAQRLFDAGKLNKEELKNYPRKNILDSALGASVDPIINLFEFQLKAGDKVFFTTDGTHEKVYLREMRMIASCFQDPNAFVERMRLLIEERNAEDNYSLVAVFAQE